MTRRSTMADPAQVSIRAMRAEIARELRVRAEVYPRLVAEGRLKQAQADWRLLVLAAVDAKLAELDGQSSGRPVGRNR
jgi:hypothetical protein